MGDATTDRETRAEFTIELVPGDPVLDHTGRFDFTKQWRGGLHGTSRGVMLSGGDPTQGRAGYVALETFEGTLDGRAGSLVLQQLGVMGDDGQTLHYLVVPGSGTGDLAGVGGELHLTASDGRHDVVLRWRQE